MNTLQDMTLTYAALSKSELSEDEMLARGLALWEYFPGAEKFYYSLQSFHTPKGIVLVHLLL